MTLTAVAIGLFVVLAVGQGAWLAIARLQERRRTMELARSVFPSVTWSWWQRSALVEEDFGTLRVQWLEVGRDTRLAIWFPKLEHYPLGMISSHPRENATLEPKRAIAGHTELQPIAWRVVGTRKAWKSRSFPIDDVLEGILTRLMRDLGLRAFWLDHNSNHLLISARFGQATAAQLTCCLPLLRSAYDQLQLASRGELQVLGMGTQAMMCGLCGQAIGVSELDLAEQADSKSCPHCGLIHHRDCWEYNGRCARCSSS